MMTDEKNFDEDLMNKIKILFEILHVLATHSYPGIIIIMLVTFALL